VAILAKNTSILFALSVLANYRPIEGAVHLCYALQKDAPRD
jgi:hypothetical protein